MIAFETFPKIEKLSNPVLKHRKWLKAYEGKRYSIAEEGRHKIKWVTEPQYYKDSKFKAEINLIMELPDRLRIEFDGNEKEAKKYLIQTEKKLQKLNFGYIKSTHKGKCPYLWIEFTRALKDKEKENFLIWIRPQGSEIDLNFKSSKKVFPVLYALHWKHSQERELPIKYFKGNKINYDSLNIPFSKVKKKKVLKNGFEYETFNSEELNLRTFEYYSKLKKPKDDLIEGIVPRKSLIVVYAPPKHMKSLFELEKCICLSSGRKFLSFKTRKTACLYIDLENNEFVIKDRWTKLRKSHNIRKKKTSLYYISRGENVNLLSQTFLEKVKQAIEKYKIGYIVIDTLPKATDYDSNSEREVNSIYVKFFKPLIEEYGCSITFLLHTNKSGKSFIGSQAYLGIVDLSFELKKKKGTNKVMITSDNRMANINFGIEFSFQEDKIKTYSFDVEKEKTASVSKLKELTEKVLSCFKEGIKLQRKDVEFFLQNNDYEYGRATLTRTLKFLVESEKLERDEKGGYLLR